MGYKKLEFIPRSPYRKQGRLWQQVGGERVKKFAFSPYTAKPRTVYNFYADIEMVKPLEYFNKLESTKFFTMPVATDTFLSFRDQVTSGEFQERVQAVIDAHGGGEIKNMSYWRSREYEGRTS